MIYENETFIINYDEKDKDYINEIIDYLNDNYRKIMDYFNLAKFENKVVINIIPTKEIIDNMYRKRFSGEPKKWVIGFANRYEIDYLSLHDYDKTTHIYEKFEDKVTYFKKTIIHEFVHSCHGEVNNGEHTSLKYLSEGLAGYLSNQYENEETKFDTTLEELKNFNGKYKYPSWYLIVKFINENYSHDYVLKLLKDKEFAYNETDKIYKEFIKNTIK